jgi:hypothetical protein
MGSIVPRIAILMTEKPKRLHFNIRGRLMAVEVDTAVRAQYLNSWVRSNPARQ